MQKKKEGIYKVLRKSCRRVGEQESDTNRRTKIIKRIISTENRLRLVFKICNSVSKLLFSRKICTCLVCVHYPKCC